MNTRTHCKACAFPKLKPARWLEQAQGILFAFSRLQLAESFSRKQLRSLAGFDKAIPWVKASGAILEPDWNPVLLAAFGLTPEN